MKNRKLWLIIAATVVLAGVIIGVRYYSASPEKEWTIGAVLPLTGPAAQGGMQAKRGLDMAAEQMGIRVVYEDSQSDPKHAVGAFRKLITLHGDRMIGAVSALSGVGNAIIPIAESERVVTIHLASAPGMTAGKKYSFRWYITSQSQMNALVAYLHRHDVRADSRIAFLFVNDDYGKGASDEFEASFQDTYGRPPVILKETYEKTQTDFRNTIAKLKAFGPQVVGIAGYNGSLGVLVRQMREQRLAARLFVGDDAVSYPDVLKVAGHSADGFVFPGLRLEPTAGTTAQGEFFNEYARRFSEPASDFAIFAYGMAKMLNACAPIGRGRDPEAIRRCLETRPLDTPLGSVSFNAETHEGRVPLVYKTIKNGAVETIDDGR